MLLAVEEGGNSRHSIMPDAMSRVLGTPELLTLILSHVEVRTLLHATRVNRAFNSIISSTRTLQQHLFFVPCKTTPPPEVITYSGEYEAYPPLTVRLVRLNPLLLHSFPNFFPKSKIGGGRTGFLDLDWAKDSTRTKSYAQAGATWRRMFLSDPAPEKMTLIWRKGNRWGEEFLKVDLQQGGQKPTMGLLFDTIQEIVVEKGRFAGGSFYLDWRVPDPNTEEEWLQSLDDWEKGLVYIEGETFDLQVRASYFYGCIAVVGPVIPLLTNESPDAQRFDVEESSQWIRVEPGMDVS
jgi:hypothetical protein